MQRKKLIIIMSVLFIIITSMVIVTNVSKQNIINTEQPKPTMVALGDSVAAGLGLYTASDISQCGRTEEAYPKVLASKLNYNLISFACSGATIPTGISGPQKVGEGTVPAQLDLLPPTSPDIITLTVGANDLGWVSLLTKCVTSICGTDQDYKDIASKLLPISTGLNETLDTLHTKYSSTQIYITGYYHMYPDSNASCSTPSIFEDSELSWLTATTDQLNNAIKETALPRSYVIYIEPDFSGHTLCSADPWINEIGESAPYHPNQQGQSVIAEQLYLRMKK